MRIVEFIGVPGVGKSTVARLAAGQLAGRGLDVRAYNLGGRVSLEGSRQGWARRRGGQALALLRQPVLGAVVARAGLSGSAAFVEMLGACQRSASLRTLRKRDGTAYLTEGPLGAACLAAFHAGDHRLLLMAVPWLALPDHIILLTTDDESAVGRIGRRGNAFVKHDESGRLRLVAGLRELHELLLSRLRLPVWRYGNDDAADETVARLVADAVSHWNMSDSAI